MINHLYPIKTVKALSWTSIIAAIILLVGCATTPPPPNNVENICSIFQQYPVWYKDAKRTEQKWGVPVPVQMSIIYQESSFSAKAKPPRKKLLGIIPWKRPSSAYGYSQALKGTWQDYVKQTGQNGDRDEFAAASDFIGWYANLVYRKCKVKPTDAYRLYLAYHEGPTNYENHSYWLKPWLIKVSSKVAKRAEVYQRQLATCQYQLEKIN